VLAERLEDYHEPRYVLFIHKQVRLRLRLRLS